MKSPRVARPRTPPAIKAGWRQAAGGQAFRAGHSAEWIAAAWLIVKGYRILGFRLKAPGAEIDILAQKGSVLAVVEVKRRRTAEQAQQALSPSQRERLRLAGERLLRQRPGLKGLRLRLDMVMLASGRFPRHRRGL
jgi:putative endonuclease